ncbi:peptidase M23 [Roseivirga ehrenbergii]|uniref:Peptidase M23 n=1 Tax=Roseivirga ehrenbergii (strain DSM 102268 / JCM 13514 / KCTC 12282 / NCIMB 14502 / KMM 6017) TaxID=279360 RepID=A0A150XCH6_ROSEK|nr:peptidase M23 [Roseivirga ehrenbergii]
MSFYLVNTVLAQWFDPTHAERETRKDLVTMSLSLDSLATELENRDLFIQSIKRVLEGDEGAGEEELAETEAGQVELSRDPNSQEIDSLFKSEFETGGDFLLGRNFDNMELRQTYLFSPISGYVSQPFDPKNEHFGIDVVSKKDEPVKCIADGTVIFASWTQDAGNVIAVQHKENLISVYKHNSALTKEVGNFISAGEILAIIGNTGELTNGPHLHFELWYNGSAVNPEDFIVF